MMLSGFSTRRAVAGLIGSAAVAAAMLFGGAALAFAQPQPTPLPPAPPEPLTSGAPSLPAPTA